MPDSNLNKGVDWPYPVNYGRENEVDADVLILGGGVAGSHAAIDAAKPGAKVVVIDKGAVIRSGSGGAGVDHWHGACTNPCSTVTLEERKQLLLLVRETPLHLGHIRNMERLCEMGAIVMPPVPAFYHKAQTIQDIVVSSCLRVDGYCLAMIPFRQVISGREMIQIGGNRDRR